MQIAQRPCTNAATSADKESCDRGLHDSKGWQSRRELLPANKNHTDTSKKKMWPMASECAGARSTGTFAVYVCARVRVCVWCICVSAKPSSLTGMETKTMCHYPAAAFVKDTGPLITSTPQAQRGIGANPATFQPPHPTTNPRQQEEGAGDRVHAYGMAVERAAVRSTPRRPPAVPGRTRSRSPAAFATAAAKCGRSRPGLGRRERGEGHKLILWGGGLPSAQHQATPGLCRQADRGCPLAHSRGPPPPAPATSSPLPGRRRRNLR